MVILLGGAVWLGVCALVLALCVSAKLGDGEECSGLPQAVLEPPQAAAARRFRRRGAALS